MRAAKGKVVQTALHTECHACLGEHVTAEHAFQINTQRRRFANRFKPPGDGKAVALAHFTFSSS